MLQLLQHSVVVVVVTWCLLSRRKDDGSQSSSTTSSSSRRPVHYWRSSVVFTPLAHPERASILALCPLTDEDVSPSLVVPCPSLASERTCTSVFFSGQDTSRPPLNKPRQDSSRPAVVHS